MRFSLLVALAALASGCDTSADGPPAWTEIGAVSTFDYQPGPDSLGVLVGTDGGAVRQKTTAQASALTLTIVATPADGSAPERLTDRRVAWQAVAPPGAEFILYDASLSFPLSNRQITVLEGGLGVTASSYCFGVGEGGEVFDVITYLRVPTVPGTADAFPECRDPGSQPQVLPVAGPETITVPAGTVTALRIERTLPFSTYIEWWSWDDGLIRFDILNQSGVLKGRFVRSAEM